MFGKLSNPYEEVVGAFASPLLFSLPSFPSPVPRVWRPTADATNDAGREEKTAKATDEKQTEVNWDILLTVWDKVAEDGEAG